MIFNKSLANDPKYAEAKKIYMEHACNTFGMSRDGTYEKYTLYNVPEEIEFLWKKEYQRIILKEWKYIASAEKTGTVKPLFAFYRLGDVADFKILKMMVTYAHQNYKYFDSFANIQVATTILKSAKQLSFSLCTSTIEVTKNALDKSSTAIKQSAIVLAMDLLHYVASNKIIILEESRERGFLFYKEETAEECLLNRVCRYIDEWSETFKSELEGYEIGSSFMDKSL